MNKMWQKGMLFAISLILGMICMTQIHTTNDILGNETPQEKAGQLNSEFAELTLQKNELKEELEVLKQAAKENEELFDAKVAELERITKELNKQQILSGYYDVKTRNNNHYWFRA